MKKIDTDCAECVPARSNNWSSSPSTRRSLSGRRTRWLPGWKVRPFSPTTHSWAYFVYPARHTASYIAALVSCVRMLCLHLYKHSVCYFERCLTTRRQHYSDSWRLSPCRFERVPIHSHTSVFSALHQRCWTAQDEQTATRIPQGFHHSLLNSISFLCASSSLAITV